MAKRKQEAFQGMHPSNPYYNNSPDFVALAELYPSLKPYVTIVTSGPKKWGKIDFRDPVALRELTYCLLRKDFSLELDIPIDSLCPAIPNRVNYICWIEDLMSCESENVIYGIDIGTGASCIYPLLGCRRNDNWRFTATDLRADINDRSIQYASKNIDSNKLQDRVTIIKSTSTQIFPSGLFKDKEQKYHFCMCNPPFYEDEREIQEGFKAKGELPSAVCQGTSNEMVTSGGEVQFVKQMVHESKQLQKRISMLGKKSSVDKIISHLKESEILNYTLTTFHQGRTTRWAIAWSFGHEHAPWASIQRTSNKMIKLTPSATVLFFSAADVTVLSAETQLKDIFDQLQIIQKSNNTNSTEGSGVQAIIQGRAKANTWSRAARRAIARKHDKLDKHDGKDGDEGIESPDIMGFDLCILPEVKKESTGSGVLIQLTWTIGHDRDIFESFFLHIRNRFLSGQISGKSLVSP
ncbi:Methyltransferase-like protein 16 [Mortierella sp. AM989]|nr:Methyltransferase-like protein 16 [Mortierella sp. AM989]